jgi:hypothetical protein
MLLGKGSEPLDEIHIWWSARRAAQIKPVGVN